MMNLAAARDKERLSIGELGKKAGIGYYAVVAIEAGTTTPTFRGARSLSDVLGMAPTEIEELNSVEKPGDLCSCGCPGVKVLPTDPNARSLMIKLACQLCGKERVYKQGRPHFLLCHACSRNSSPIHRAFAVALRKTLNRKGWSLQQLRSSHGIHSERVDDWIQGRMVPLRSSVKRLADAVDAPELVELIPSLAGPIVMTCIECHSIFKRKSRQLRKILERGFHPEACVDWDNDVGTYRCASCSSRHRLDPYFQLMKKRYGRKFFVEKGKRLAASYDPGRPAKDKRKPRRTARKFRIEKGKRLAASYNPGRPAEAKAKKSRRLTAYPKMKLQYCRLCPMIVMTEHGLGEVHKKCLNDYLAQWGLPFGSYPPPLPRRGNFPSAQDLAITYAICVSHLLWEEPIGDVNKDGEKTGLVAVWGLARQSIISRIRTFLRHLPTDERCPKKFRHLVDALRGAAEKKFSYKL